MYTCTYYICMVCMYTKNYLDLLAISPQPDIFRRQFYVNISKLKFIVKSLSCDCEVTRILTALQMKDLTIFKAPLNN